MSVYYIKNLSNIFNALKSLKILYNDWSNKLVIWKNIPIEYNRTNDRWKVVQRLACHSPACFQGKFLANCGGDSMGSRPLCYHADRRNRAFSIVASHVHCVMVSRNNKESTFSCITTHLLLLMIIFNTFSALGRVNSLLECSYRMKKFH